MAKKTTTKDKDEIISIASGTFSRGVSLMGMTVSSGARFLGFKVADVFGDKADSKERFNKYLAEQASILVDELGQLKGSVMKVGQLLSLYGEQFLPPEVNQILKKLQSESKPVSWDVMEKVIRKQLGDEIFEELEFDKKAVAAASLGQVYRAVRKKDGKILALKVQYPGVDKAIESDLKAIKTVLTLSKLVPKGPAFDEVFKEVRMMMNYESDYKREISIVTEYQKLLEGFPQFIIPEVFPEYSTKRVLCMSFEEGVAIDSTEVDSYSQSRRNKIGVSLMELMCKEIFEWRMVQTDPHFGNYKIRTEEGIDKIVLFDFGAVRKFSLKYTEPFSRLVQAVLDDHDEDIFKTAIDLGFLRENDKKSAVELFVDICLEAAEGFREKFESPYCPEALEGEKPYHWSKTDLVERLSLKAKDAVFAFKLRPPPREMVFIDRKMMGTYFIVRRLDVRYGPRKMLLKYLEPYVDKNE